MSDQRTTDERATDAVAEILREVGLGDHVIHSRRIADAVLASAFSEQQGDYIEEADANPERRDNGCQIYRTGSND